MAAPRAENSDIVARGWETLSPRELQMIERVAWDMSYRQIGDELGISRRTVESCVNKAIFEKLGINDRKVLGRLARERGLGLRPPRPIPNKKKSSDGP
ncbi:MAG: response regulator transcription factor [Actinomycetota bacterium]